jgi:hypothetical protein
LVLCAVLSGALSFAAPAGAAAAAEADFEVHSGSAHGKVGAVAGMSGWYRNKGPSDAITGTATLEIELPGGAEFYSAKVPANCTVVVPRKYHRCRNPGFWPSGYKSPTSFLIKIVSTNTSPGFMSVTYADDPKPGNNRAALTLTIDGVAKPKPTPTTAPATTKAAPKPSATKSTATKSSSPTSAVASSSPSPSQSRDAVIDALPRSAAASDTLPLVVSVVAAGVLVAVGVFGMVIWRRRRDDGGEPGTG